MRATIARGVAHFSYTPLLGFAAAVSFGKLIVYAALVDVAQFGVLGKMLFVSSVFGMGASLGLQSVASRDLPALIAKGRERRGMRLLVHTIAVAMWVGVLCLLAVAAGASLFDLTAEELTLGVIHGWVQLAFLTVAFESRSRLHMMRYSRDMAMRNSVIAGAGVVAVWIGLGARGVVLAEVAGTVVFLFLVGRSALARARVRWAWLARALTLQRARLPWRAALLMCAGTIVMFASFNLDRWIAAEVLSKIDFGVYAFGWLVLLAAQSLQALLNSGLLPLLARRRAESLESTAYRLTSLISMTLLAAGLIVAAPAAWTLVWFVDGSMPRYTAAGTLWVPLLLAAVFRVADFWSSLLLVVEREGQLLTVQTAAMVVAGAGYAVWLGVSSTEPTPTSLAWLAFAGAVLSHAASAAAVVWTHRTAHSLPNREDHAE